MDEYLNWFIWLGVALVMGIGVELWQARRKRVGGLENGRGVEGHALTGHGKSGDSNSRTFIRPSVHVEAGIKPGRPFSELPSPGEGGDAKVRRTKPVNFGNKGAAGSPPRGPAAFPSLLGGDRWR